MEKIELMNQAEQNMQRILENRQEELDAFLFDHSIEHPIAKAFIAFAQAYHHASKIKGHGSQPPVIER